MALAASSFSSGNSKSNTGCSCPSSHLLSGSKLCPLPPAPSAPSRPAPILPHPAAVQLAPRSSPAAPPLLLPSPALTFWETARCKSWEGASLQSSFNKPGLCTYFSSQLGLRWSQDPQLGKGNWEKKISSQRERTARSICLIPSITVVCLPHLDSHPAKQLLALPSHWSHPQEDKCTFS